MHITKKCIVALIIAMFAMGVLDGKRTTFAQLSYVFNILYIILYIILYYIIYYILYYYIMS